MVVDTLSNLHALDPNSQEQAKAFIGLLITIGQSHDWTFVLLAHPSRSGMASGMVMDSLLGGAMPFGPVHTLRPTPAIPASILLTSKKANYGKRGLAIKAAWTEGYYVKVNDEYADVSKAKHVFLEILDRLTKEETFVSWSNGVNYAPHRFVEEPEADEENITKGQFVTAMKSMLRDGVLVSEGLCCTNHLLVELPLTPDGLSLRAQW